MRIVQQALIPILHSFLANGKDGACGGGRGVPKISHGPHLTLWFPAPVFGRKANP